MKKILARIQNKCMLRAAGVEDKLASAKEEGDHLLEVLGTIIIAVVILILFKDSILGIFQSALGQTTTSVNNLFTQAVSVP